MTFQGLREVVPWGRSLAEYVGMLSLSEQDLAGSILDCGAGPASFAAEAHALGRRVTACDPIYRFSAAEIAKRVEEVFPVMVEGMETERHRFVWTDAISPEAVGERRLAAMRLFLGDFDNGRAEGRYVVGGLPSLPFPDGEFDLALSSHFLFLYSAQLSIEFHVEGLRELVRVAREVRVFPLLNLSGRPSEHLGPVLDDARANGHFAAVVQVGYEFQRGGNSMLVIRRSETRYQLPERNTIDRGQAGV